MKTEQAQIKEFMLNAEQDCPEKPTMPEIEVRKLRVKLIAEELCEFAKACRLVVDIYPDATREMSIEVMEDGIRSNHPDIVEVFDAIEDIMVVTVGAGVAFGLPLQEGWDETHRSNMSKFTDGYKREDGKWMKGPSYFAADLAPIIKRHL